MSSESSDSDSDGSYISATPPRNSPIKPLSNTLQKPSKTSLKYPLKPSKKPLKSPLKNPKKPTKKPLKSPPKNPIEPNKNPPPSSIFTTLPSFSLPIRRPNCSNSETGGEDSSIRAGSLFLSKSKSFSKFHRSGLSFGGSEKDQILGNGSGLESGNEDSCEGGGGDLGSLSSFSKFNRSSLSFDCSEKDQILGNGSSSKAENEVTFEGGGGDLGSLKIKSSNCSGTESGISGLSFDFSEKDPHLASGSGSKSVNEVSFGGGDGDSGCLKKRLSRKPSNCIGSGSKSTSLLAPKKAKISNEGNFVKLNINGYGRKFTFKSKYKNYKSSSSRRGYYKRGFKRRFSNKSGVESNDLCEEEGLVLERSGKEAKEGGKLCEIDAEVLKNAVLDVRNEASDSNLVKLLKITHGYDAFREGQLDAIKLVLDKKSTMLVLPTGAGKSLCYQLPAIVFPGITLVVSPLMALMIDQLRQLPSVVNGALLSSSQSFEEMSDTLSLLREGKIKVLFVSPERFLNEEFMSIISTCSLISLVVIDEAHCVSEWSHNFRPSYMRLRASVLRDELNAQCILAMTATATSKTLYAVMHALEIPSTNLVKTLQLRNNFHLSVSISGNSKIKDLIAIIKSSPYSELKSIIIYCKFQSETDMVSKYLCDNNVSAMSYHSGMMAKDRSRVQALFCSNKTRVVVATVAFGMGLDKSDVGAVIHYSLPESLEEYVQEIGRAGRDGRISYCHLLLDDNTYFKLRSLMYSDGIDEYEVNKLLHQVFSNGMELKGEVQSMIKESASRKCDIKEEVILTILTQLELGEVQYLRLLPQMNVTCSLNFHKTPKMELAAKDALVAAILNKSENKHGLHVFDIPAVANSIGLTPTELLNHLKNLKAGGEITYELKDPAYCYVVVRAPTDLCSLATQMTKWLSDIECCKVRKLDMMFNAAVSAEKLCGRIDGCDGVQHTPSLQKRISDYFSEENHSDLPTKMNENSPFLRADIKVFLQSNSAAKFTPRAVARVMHGIGSPAYPSATWSKTHFWGRYLKVDFKAIMEAAKAELMNFVGKDGP